MKMKKTLNLDLDSLGVAIPTLTPGKSLMLKEACRLCLLDSNHDEDVEINASYKNQNRSLPVHWGKEKCNHRELSRAYNPDDAIQFGAEALSLLLIRECTEYTAIERAATGTGIDYWLGTKKKNQSSLFSNKSARLEISGIFRETKKNNVPRRVKQKLSQVKRSDRTCFPVFVSIIEFSQPRSEMVLNDVNY